MKRILLFTLLIFISLIANSQQDTIRKNAISIGIKAYQNPLIELGYDRIISRILNTEFYIGCGARNTGYFTPENLYYAGGRVEIYPNGHRLNRIRFLFSSGLEGGIGRTRPFVYYEPQENMILTSVLVGVGLAYFGKGGFHFKILNSVGVEHSIVEHTQYQYIYYDDNGNPSGGNPQTYTYNELNMIFKPTIRFGYRF